MVTNVDMITGVIHVVNSGMEQLLVTKTSRVKRWYLRPKKEINSDIVFLGREVLRAENYDLDAIVTPVKPQVLHKLLTESGYDKIKTEFLVNGFTKGFDLHYEGPRDMKRYAVNHRSQFGDDVDIWNKIMVEVQSSRVAGPFQTIPYYEYFQVSPLKVVPKGENKLRLVYNLSYPPGQSVNDGVPQHFRTTKYPDFNDAVKLCIEQGVGAYMGRSDIQHAFRLAPVRVEDRPLQVMVAKDPETGKDWYFVDLNLPFGHAHSCNLFCEVSLALSHLVKHRSGCDNLMYLDDLFVTNGEQGLCNQHLTHFLDVCSETGIPVAEDKTEWASQLQTFVGLLIDTVNQVVCIPLSKRQKALEQIELMLNSKKTTVLCIQKLTGLLNFLCKAIVPGRCYTRRLYSKYKGLKHQHHHVRVDSEMRNDLLMWLDFLQDEVNSVCRPFADFSNKYTAEDLGWYTDSSFTAWGSYFAGRWSFGIWDDITKDMLSDRVISIQFLELFAIAISLEIWGFLIANKRVEGYCDNQAVVHMVNNGTSGCRYCMILIRRITLMAMKHNFRLLLKFVKTDENGIADSLSRLDFDRFRKLAPLTTNKFNDNPQCDIWPIPPKWWNKNSY